MFGAEKTEPAEVVDPVAPMVAEVAPTPRDARADYEGLARVAAAGNVSAEERSALALAALRAAGGAYADAVESVGPVAGRVMEARYVEQTALLSGISLADHDAPSVRRVRAALMLAEQCAAEKRWAEAVAARAEAIAALPEARVEIGKRLGDAAEGAIKRGDRSLAVYFYQQALRLSPENAVARTYLYANRFAPGQLLRTKGGIELAYIPPGSYLRGSRFSEPGRESDEAQATVTLTAGFAMSVTEVTQRQWDEVFGPGAAARMITAAPAGSDAVEPGLPMHSIRWDEAAEFCRRLSAKDGARYRLPTEAEWEYACRAGTVTAFNTGADYLGLSDAVIDDGSSTGGMAPVPVGTVGRPNAWGLRDTHGNVWEWCADWSAPYPSGDAIAPTGPDDAQMGRADLAMRTVRGGGWNTPARDARSANRWEYSPAAATGYIGLRFVMEPDLAAP
jgi:formylglycine-generating enzyme required for sulfatase activity